MPRQTASTQFTSSTFIRTFSTMLLTGLSVHFEGGWESCSSAFTCFSRFAQFFISPLFAEDATSREILAVDSGFLFVSEEEKIQRNLVLFPEFKMSLQNDSIRHREVFCLTSRPSHPSSKFGWGKRTKRFACLLLTLLGLTSQATPSRWTLMSSNKGDLF